MAAPGRVGQRTMDSATMGSPAPVKTVSGARSAALAALLLIDFVLVVVMLATDKNLQTDFGAVAPYYSHWYGLLAEGVVDLAVAIGVIVLVVVPARQGRSVASRRWVPIGALVWALIAIAANVGIVTSWKMVGFPNQAEFEKYLFGTSAYPGALSYIPWLYDALLAAYVVTALVGIVAVLRVRAKRPST
jgi:hypothetical protein